MWKFTNEYVPNNTYGKINEFSRNNLSIDELPYEEGFFFFLQCATKMTIIIIITIRALFDFEL